MNAYVYRDKRRDWWWRVVAGNGRITHASTEGYRRRGDCLVNLEPVMDGLGIAEWVDLSFDAAVARACGTGSRARTTKRGAACGKAGRPRRASRTRRRGRA